MLDVKRRQRRGGIAVATDGVVSSATRALELEAELQAAIAADGLVLEYQPVVGPDGRVLLAGGVGALASTPTAGRSRRPSSSRSPSAAGCCASWTAGCCARPRPRPPAGRHPRAACPPSPSTSPGCCRATPTSRSRCATPFRAAGLPGTGWCWSWWRPASSRCRRTRWPPWRAWPSRASASRVDDFGTGYSSLARLKELPAQTVKVDRAFVTGIAEDPVDFAVARAVVDMAHAMGRDDGGRGRGDRRAVPRAARHRRRRLPGMAASPAR